MLLAHLSNNQIVSPSPVAEEHPTASIP